jgi:uncharacterized protein (DUF2252 family)
MVAMASFSNDNTAYEEWLRTQCDVVDADLDHKHERMKKIAFVFMRATYFRWAKRISQICPDLEDARQVLSVGDIHLENFGTWRDVEGRLVWGVNDFDEAATMPYPLDLVRLAASVRLSKFPLNNSDAAEAILDGYKAGLSRRGGCGRTSPARTMTGCRSGARSILIRLGTRRSRSPAPCSPAFLMTRRCCGSPRA